MPWNYFRRENVFLHLSILIILILIYLPSLNGSFFSSDDAQLVFIPQFASPIAFQNILSIFMPGNHIDFYPIRDLSYLLDSLVFNLSPFAMRIENLIFLFITYLYFFKLFTFFDLDLKVKSLFSAVWIFSFFHLEQIMWISARKDLLALMFAMISIYYFFLHEKIKKQYLNYFWLIAFILSIFSKASFGLLPIFYMAYHFLIKKDPIRLKFIATSFVIMIANALFQSWFYSKVTNMTYQIAYLDRVHISLSALGRMLLGMIYYPVNAIDFFNFGDWLIYNQKYEVLGLITLLLTFGLITYSFYKKRHVTFLVFLLILLVYLPISGLIFPHKMFYSTRYFIPIFTILIFTCAALVNKSKKVNPLIFATLLVFNISCLKLDLPNWESNFNIRKKAVNHSPDSLYPNTQLLLEIMDGKINSNIDKMALISKIDSKCSSENNLSCLRYYLVSKEVFKEIDPLKSRFYWTKYLLTLNLYRYNKDDILINEIRDGLKSALPPVQLIEKWKTNKTFFTTTEERLWDVISNCKESKIAIDMLNHYLSQKLMRDKDVQAFISSDLSTENKAIVSNCLRI